MIHIWEKLQKISWQWLKADQDIFEQRFSGSGTRTNALVVRQVSLTGTRKNSK